MKHPRGALRLPLKGATPAARQNRFRSVSGLEGMVCKTVLIS